jgi:hypothetical protein
MCADERFRRERCRDECRDRSNLSRRPQALCRVLPTLALPRPQRVALVAGESERPSEADVAEDEERSFVGAMFETVATHVPPAAGLASPMLCWKPAAPRRALWTRRDVRSSPAHVYVPRRLRIGVRRVLCRLPRADRESTRGSGSDRDVLERDIEELALTWNRLKQPGPIAVPATSRGA